MVEFDKDTAAVVMMLRSNSGFQRLVAYYRTRLQALDASGRTAEGIHVQWNQGRRQEIADFIAAVSDVEKTTQRFAVQEQRKQQKGVPD